MGGGIRNLIKYRFFPNEMNIFILELLSNHNKQLFDKRNNLIYNIFNVIYTYTRININKEK